MMSCVFGSKERAVKIASQQKGGVLKLSIHLSRDLKIILKENSFSRV